MAIWGIVSRLSARNALEKQAASAAVATVITAKAHRGPGADNWCCPAACRPSIEAPIYARTNGYLKIWHTDIGTPVKKGQLLAEIETPEVDQQLRQAQADLATAEANYQLARTTNERWKGLLATESVSQQDADQRAGDAAAKSAARQSAAANLARLQETGILQARAGTLRRRRHPAQHRRRRPHQRRPEFRQRAVSGRRHAPAAHLRLGTAAVRLCHPSGSQTAGLVFADRPGKRYEAVVANTAHALDATSRTLQVELQIDNTSGELLPGSYAQVYFDRSPATRTRCAFRSTPCCFAPQGLQVAILDAQHRVHLQTITQGRDFGTEIEVLSGVAPEDTLVVNPPDSITDGVQVRIAPPQPPAGQARARPDIPDARDARRCRPCSPPWAAARSPPLRAPGDAGAAGCLQGVTATGRWRRPRTRRRAGRGGTMFQDPDLNDLEDAGQRRQPEPEGRAGAPGAGTCPDAHRPRQLLSHA